MRVIQFLNQYIFSERKPHQNDSGNITGSSENHLLKNFEVVQNNLIAFYHPGVNVNSTGKTFLFHTELSRKLFGKDERPKGWTV